MSDISNRDSRRGGPRPIHRRDQGSPRDGSSRDRGREGGNNRDRSSETTIDRELLAELEREEPSRSPRSSIKRPSGSAASAPRSPATMLKTGTSTSLSSSG